MRTIRCILTVWSFFILICPPSYSDAPAVGLGDIARAMGINKGLVIYVGPVEDTVALGRGTEALAHGLAEDAAAVKQARAGLHQSGLVGRVTVSAFDGRRLPFIDQVANLIVVTTGNRLNGEVARVLAPRGIVVLRSPLTDCPTTLSRIDSPVPGWVAYRRTVPDEIDDWSHYMHGPNNNAVAADTRVGPPSRLQWVADPKWNREHDMLPGVFSVISEKGRLFYILDQGLSGAVDERFPLQFYLRARDAFNGTPLWKRKMENWYLPRTTWGHLPMEAHRRLVADGDSLYVTMGINAPVSKLDAKTGQTVAVYDATRNASELIVADGVLLAAISDTSVKALRQQDNDRQHSTAASIGKVVTQGQAIIAVDVQTGKTLWQVEPGAVPMTLAADGGHVVYAQHGQTICRSIRDGKQLWEAPGQARSLVIHKDVVLTATFPRRLSVELKATRIADGKPLWSRTGTHLPSFTMFHIPVDIFVVDDVVWAIGDKLEWRKSGGSGTILGLHYGTGRQVSQIPAKGAFGAGHHQRCYPNKATENYLLMGKRGTEFLGLKPGDRPLKYQWVRGVCRYGILPCNGLLYAPPHSCVCSPGAQLTGFNALAPQTGAAPYPLTTGRAQPGPAYGHWREDDDADNWSMYRADPMRHSTSQTILPQGITIQWETDFGSRITPAVQANGRVYVSVVDKHQVAAIDAATGKVLWTHHCGARVDSPPTVYKGQVVFGCRDGWVTALRDTDGMVVWRFRAAPNDRRLVARDQLESVWPVLGSVLVINDIAYVAAGRSLFLDGGIYLYGLEAKTGKVRYRERLKPLDENTDKTMKVSTSHMSGAALRILQADAKRIYMGHVLFDHKLQLPAPPGEATYTMTPRGQDRILPYSGFLDDSGYNRNYWAFRNFYGQYPQDRGRAQLMVQDGNNLYGVRYFWGRGWNSPVFKAGDGYILYERKADDPIESGDGPHRLALNHYTWHTNIPVRVNAMVVARMKGAAGPSPCLAVAGAPDVVDPVDPLAAFEGRKGAVLQLRDASTGELRHQLPLPSPPVFDGMIAAEQSLVISLQSGKVIRVGSVE